MNGNHFPKRTTNQGAQIPRWSGSKPPCKANETAPTTIIIRRRLSSLPTTLMMVYTNRTHTPHTYVSLQGREWSGEGERSEPPNDNTTGGTPKIQTDGLCEAARLAKHQQSVAECSMRNRKVGSRRQKQAARKNRWNTVKCEQMNARQNSATKTINPN